MSIKQFYTDLKKGMPAPAYLFYSDDAYLLSDAALRIKKLVPDEERDFKFHSFDLESSDFSAPIDQIVDVLNTVPFMGGRQVVVIEGIRKLNAAGLKVLGRYLSNPSPTSLLAMFYEGKMKKTTKDNLEACKQIALNIAEKDLPYWVQETAAQKGVEFPKSAVDYLIGTIGTEMGLLSSEIEKFASLGKAKVDKDEVASLIQGFGSGTAFDLIDAIQAKDSKRAFKLLSILAETQDPQMLMGALNWHYERMGGGREKKNAAVYRLLHEADFLVKSSGGAYPIEHLVVKLLRS